jgi:hypothetical protein
MKLTASWAGFKLVIRIYFFSVACIPLIICAESANVLQENIYTVWLILVSMLVRLCTYNEKTRITIVQQNAIVYDKNVWYTVANFVFPIFVVAMIIEVWQYESLRHTPTPKVDSICFYIFKATTNTCLPLNVGCISDYTSATEFNGFCVYVLSTYWEGLLFGLPYFISFTRISFAFNITISLCDAIKMVLRRWKPKQTPALPNKDTPTKVDPCAICRENQRQICLPCGHFIMCFGCYDSVKANKRICPMCNQAFKKGIRVFQN